MTDRYAVIGNPIAHSKSPAIHAAFALQTGQKLNYTRLEAPLDGFSDCAAEFLAMGGKGCNVTVPFKEEAYRFANRLSARAELAGAVNTLWLDDDGLVGDNTDGAGLCRDLLRHTELRGKRILLLGAGGAARGVIAPLLAEKPARLLLANRSADKATQLAERFSAANLQATGLDALAGQAFDLVINATSASLAGQQLPLPPSLWRLETVAYDMMYGKEETPFLAQAAAGGVAMRLDGLGMLVEQAAEAFYLWRGVRPETQPVLTELRAALGTH
ncbi:shikimate dehydrogenase [Chitinimonas arctica]|uniref:Shikimate dehydrogenase (NADP(+)) n=1 Tax=Chitinimonas arctica TaxID=2594795 RepID=A0A516SGE9_9NEIS|nr:shikimate dehydrogenase [Chitinimonas arctica]QDQ27235.1 shikimate dehydrogenase [Chitinimonas arctica]